MDSALTTAKKNARRAREQRNATTNNEDFDYWHGIMVQYEQQIRNIFLKTGDNK